jgi:hypothetical protein
MSSYPKWILSLLVFSYCSCHKCFSLWDLSCGFGVITAVVMKVAICWDTEPRSQYMSRCIGGMYHLHLQGQKLTEQGTTESRWLGIYSRWYLALLILGPEDASDTFLQNVCSCADYTALNPRRWQLLFSNLFSSGRHKHVESLGNNSLNWELQYRCKLSGHLLCHVHLMVV